MQIKFLVHLSTASGPVFSISPLVSLDIVQLDKLRSWRDHHDILFESLTISNRHMLLYHDAEVNLEGPRAHGTVHMIQTVI